MKFACYFFGVTSVDVHFRSTSLHSKRSLHRFNHTLSYRHCHLFWASSLKIANEACFLFFSFELFSDPMSSSSGDSEMMLQGSIPFGPFHIVQISSGLFVCLRTTSLDHFRLVAGFRSRPDRWFWWNSKSGDIRYAVRQTTLMCRSRNASMLQFRKSIIFVVPDSSRHLFLYCVRYWYFTVGLKSVITHWWELSNDSLSWRHLLSPVYYYFLVV